MKNDIKKINWVKDSIFYQIFVDRFFNGNPENDPDVKAGWEEIPTRSNFFGGDLQGILKKLPYLKSLGINAIYLNPVFKAGKNHKYDTWDYLSIDPIFGKDKDLKRLVKQCHSNDIRVILDGVFNHCGDGFWAFRDVAEKGKHSKYYDWFFIQGEEIKKAPINYQTAGGCAYLPKINFENPEARKYILDAVDYWNRNTDLDGWRLDVPWKVDIDFWKEFRNLVKKRKPGAYLVGEIWRDPVPWVGNGVFDGTMNYKLRDLIIDYCIRGNLDAEDFNYEIKNLIEILGEKMQFMLNILGSHDTPRILTIAKNNIDKVILAMVVLFTVMGTPMIYYGDEIGITGGNDPGCRKTMSWEQKSWNRKMNNIYKLLIALRKKHRCLRTGSFETLKVFNRFYCYLRSSPSDNIIVAINSGKKQPRLEITLPERLNKFKKWNDMIYGKDYECKDNKLVLTDIDRCVSLVLIPSGY